MKRFEAEMAHAFPPPSNGARYVKNLNGDIHINSDYNWIYYEPDPDEKGFNLYTVLIHELGHSLEEDKNQNYDRAQWNSLCHFEILFMTTSY